MDYMLPGMNGIAALQELRRSDPTIKVVLVTGHGSVQVAVDAMKAGASDYLSKPIVLSELKLLLDKVLEQRRVDGELAYYRDRAAEHGNIDLLLGESAPMHALKDALRRLIDAERSLTDDEPPSVLITGETGTGKELVARALHFDGARKNHPFVEFNCAAFPADLVESELFGYERGAFTNASQRKLGLVESAEGGTVFLDEVASLDPGTQAKLLKLLEDRMVRRLGSVRENRANVRFIAAANENLQHMVRDGRFRSDLFFRLRISHLHLPPLRERGADTLFLARQFLNLHAKRYGKPPMRFTADAEQLLLAYRWPGNVRELRNAMEHAVLMARGELVTVEQITFCQPLDAPVPSNGQAVPPSPAQLALSDSPFNLEQMERDLVERAIEQAKGNVSHAARLLGITRDTLRYRIEKYGLKLA